MGQHMCFSQSLFYTWRIKGRRNFGTMQNRPTFKCFHFPTEWKSSHPSSSNTVTLHSPILCGTWQSCTSRCLQWCTRIHVCPQQNGFTGLQGVTLICLYTVGNLLHWQLYSRTTCRNCLWESWSFWGFPGFAGFSAITGFWREFGEEIRLEAGESPGELLEEGKVASAGSFRSSASYVFVVVPVMQYTTPDEAGVPLPSLLSDSVPSSDRWVLVCLWWEKENPGSFSLIEGSWVVRSTMYLGCKSLTVHFWKTCSSAIILSPSSSSSFKVEVLTGGGEQGLGLTSGGARRGLGSGASSSASWALVDSFRVVKTTSPVCPVPVV